MRYKNFFAHGNKAKIKNRGDCMKKNTKRVIAMSAALMLSMITMASCAGGGGGGGSDKATLYVYSFTSGFGSQWFTNLIADFEEVHKNTEIDGKMGINVEPVTDKKDVDAATMRGRDEVIYFLEQKDYYELVDSGYVADISDAVTKPNPYDEGGKTLESKMFEDQRTYFAREVNGKTCYYAYPHYFTSFGITYDVELFDEKGYYLAEGYDPTGDLQYVCIGQNDWEKTAGPDGQKGNDDDGLPATYEEFLLLCDYIATKGNDNPLLWSGEHRNAYLTHFINALAADFEGYEQMRLNFTFNGEAKNLGVAKDGEFVEDAENTVIDGSNGAELARQAGKFYAMDLYEDLYKKEYVSGDAYEETLFGSYSHLSAQRDFLSLAGDKSGKRHAMLLDGSWWHEEATGVFNEFVDYENGKYNEKNRRVGWMPLPKSTKSESTKSTLYDIMYPLLLMKNGLDTNSWQYKYAIDFIQFANSDEQLAKFTQLTGCTKALNYSLTSQQYEDLSYFGKSYYDIYKASDIVFPYAKNDLFGGNQATFKEIDNTGAGSPLYKSTDYATYFTAALENGHSSEGYFNGMYEYFGNLAIWKKVI